MLSLTGPRIRHWRPRRNLLRHHRSKAVWHFRLSLKTSRAWFRKSSLVRDYLHRHHHHHSRRPQALRQLERHREDQPLSHTWAFLRLDHTLQALRHRIRHFRRCRHPVRREHSQSRRTNMISYRARATPRDPEPEPLHDFSSTQVPVTGRAAEIMRKMQSGIQPGDVGSEGIEHKLHVTCRYGLHFQTPSGKLRTALKEFGPIKVTFGATSLFSIDDADVLKVDVDSPDLHRLYKLIGRVVPVHNTHPAYRPHATLAYLKIGRGKKYTGDKAMAGQTLTYHSIVFSGKRGHMESIPLGTAPPGPYRVR